MLEWIISSTVLILTVIALRFILKGKISLRLQYALWAIVLLRLIIPVSFGSAAISVGNLTQKAAETEAGQIVSALSDTELPSKTYRAAYDEVAKEYAEKGVDISEIPAMEFSETIDYEIMARMNGSRSIRDIIQIVWIIGIAAVGLVLIASNIHFSVRLKKSRQCLEGQSVVLPVYASPNVDTPCLFGLFRPAIYLTPEAAADDTVLRHSIQHELTHFRHGDHFWSLLRGACLALHWYNPLVWRAAVLSRNDAELACDEATIRRIGENERAEYGRTLIEMTCQKRPALLLTATTMTGSANSIKERITMIAKKPKTAIYTLIAVILIVAVATGCAFTGAKEDSIDYTDEWFATEAWTWAEEYAAENGLSIAKNNYTVFRHTDNKSVDVVFSESNGARSVQIAFEQNEDGTWAVVPANAVNLIERDRRGIQISVSNEIANNIPAAVLDYAQDYVAQEADSWNNGNFENGIAVQHINKITEAKITGITQVNTGTAALDYSINMYLLEYRLLPEDQDNIVLAGGMRADLIDGRSWLTEWGSTGQPYLLLLAEDDNWTRICVTNTDSIDFDYGTPEMLEQYGDKYTAAAMELYSTYRKNQIAVTVDDAAEDIYGSGLVHEIIADNSDLAVNVQFSAKSTVTNFRLLEVNPETVDDAGNIRFSIAEELYSLPELTPEKPLAARLIFAGDIPNIGISYIDASGIEQTYAVTMSGKDGSLILVEADISELQGGNLLDPERWGNTSDDTGNMTQDTAVVDAITDVLIGNAVFFETGLTEEIDISHLSKAFTSDDAAIMEIAGFSCIDLDKDGTLEVILSLTMNGNNAFGFEVLRYHNGTVYGYSLWYREFYALKTDGSFSYSGGAANSGFGTIRFTDETFTVEKLAYAESSYGSDNKQIVSYFIDNKSTSLVEFEAAIKKQEKKSDVSWYDFADAVEYFRHTSDISQTEVNKDEASWYLDYFLRDSGFVTLLELEEDGAFTDEAMGAYCLHKLAHYDYENGNTKEAYNKEAKKYFGRTITDFNNAMLKEIPGSPEFVRATGWSFDSSAWMVLRSLSKDNGVFTGQFYCSIIPDSYWTGEKNEFEATKKALLSGDASGLGTVSVREIEFEKKTDENGNVYLLYRSLKTVEDNVVDIVPFN